MAMTAAQVAQKWATNLAAAGPSITAGIDAVQEAPGVAAARNQAGYLAGVQQNVNKWATNVAKMDLQTWKTRTKDLGAQRIAGGANAAVPKMTQFLNVFLPFQAGITAQTRSMPRGTLQQNIARAVNQMTQTANFPGY